MITPELKEQLDKLPPESRHKVIRVALQCKKLGISPKELLAKYGRKQPTPPEDSFRD